MNYKYENRIVAFIDILGFTSIIKSTLTSNQSLNNLVGALNYVQNYFKKVRKEYSDPSILQLTQFSDTLVMSVSMKDSLEMVSIFKHLKIIQINLINKNVLLRGGIVKGLLVHNNDLIIGPGMINAYKLESRCALHPRIVIDPRVMWQFVRSNGVNQKKRLKNFYKQGVFQSESDGVYFIDYFNDVEDYLEEITLYEYYQKLCSITAKNIENDDISIRAKYLWMREKLKSSQYYDQFETDYKRIVNRRNKGKK